MNNPNPTSVQYLLYSMVLAFFFALTFIPAFATSIAKVLIRHASAIEAAYRGYRTSWNEWSEK